MTLARYALGVGMTAVVVVAVGFAATRVRRRLLPGWSASPARLAEVLIGISLLTFLGEALGAVGAFRPAPLVAGCLIAAMVSRWIAPADNGPRPIASAPPGPWLAMSPALLAVAVLAAQWASRTAAAVGRGMPNMDTLWYHMPFAARFVQTGWVTRLHVTHQEPLTSFFPANSELLHAVSILPFHRDLLSPLLNLGWLAVALIAGWCIGRPLGAAPLTMTAVAAVVAVPILSSTQPGDATNDVMAVSCFLAAVAVLVTGELGMAELIVAGLAAGLALGTKLSLVAPVAALTVGVLAVGRRRARRAVIVGWLPALAATGGFWYLRNLVRAGSPVPTLRIGVGTLALPRVRLPVTGRTNFAVVHYLTDRRVWEASLLPALRVSLGEAWPLLLGLAALGAAAALLSGPHATDRMLGIVAVAAAVAYTVTPQTAAGPQGHPTLFAFNLRFLTPAVALGLALLARGPLLQRPAARWGLLGALAVVLVVAETRSRYAWPSGYRELALAVAVVTVVGAVTAFSLSKRPLPGRLLVAAVAGGAIVVAAVGWPVQRQYLRHRYVRSHEWVAGAYDWARGVRESRIGIAGFVQQYPLYGTDLSNWVEYVGRKAPRGGFRQAETCTEWADALRLGRYRYIVLAPEGAPSEARWTAADPAATELLRTGPVIIYRLDSRDGGSCGGVP